MKGTAPSVLFINRFYRPDVSATAQMLTDLAEGLAQQGWDVTVLTGRQSYDARERFPSYEEHAGVRIHRVWSTGLGRDQLARRAVDYTTFAVALLLRLMRSRRTDVIVAMTDPPFVVAPALLAGRLRRSVTIHWVQDLYPELFARLGYLKEQGAAYRLLRRLMRRIHASVPLTVALGPAMQRALLEAGAPSDRVACIHNWADSSAITPVPCDANEFLLRHGLHGKFVVLYSGNAGRAHTFDAVLGAARLLRDRDDIVFLFIGGGRQTAVLRRRAAEEGLAIRFMDYLPRSELRYSLSAGSVCLVTERPEVVGTLVPSKTYGILASGRPVVFVGSPDSDVAGVIRNADCGVIVAPDDAAGLAHALRTFQQSPAECRRVGARARAAAERVYDRSLAVSAWAELLGRVTGSPQAAAGSALPRSGSLSSLPFLQTPRAS